MRYHVNTSEPSFFGVGGGGGKVNFIGTQPKSSTPPPLLPLPPSFISPLPPSLRRPLPQVIRNLDNTGCYISFQLRIL